MEHLLPLFGTTPRRKRKKPLFRFTVLYSFLKSWIFLFVCVLAYLYDLNRSFSAHSVHSLFVYGFKIVKNNGPKFEALRAHIHTHTTNFISNEIRFYHFTLFDGVWIFLKTWEDACPTEKKKERKTTAKCYQMNKMFGRAQHIPLFVRASTHFILSYCQINLITYILLISVAHAIIIEPWQLQRKRERDSVTFSCRLGMSINESTLWIR